MHLRIAAISTVAQTRVLRSLLASMQRLAPPPANGGIANFTNIATAIQNVVTGIFEITTPLAVLLIIGAGIFLMFDRNHSFQARLEKLYFLKNVLIGYAIIFAANFVLNTLTQILASGGITH